NNKIDKQFDSIRNVIIGINNDLDNELKEKNTISYNVRNDGTIITYKDLDEANEKLKKEKDSISTLLHELESKYNSSKSELDHIKEVYPIKYIRKNYKKNGREYIEASVYAPKIDSA